MTFEKPNSFSFASLVATVSSIREKFAVKSTAPLDLTGPNVEPLAQDRSRYAMMLEEELNDRGRTPAELGESHSLSQLRAALYAD